jgi:hypothetical protein
MTNRPPETPEQVRKFAPKPRPEASHPTDDAGNALIVRLQQAAKVSNENCDRAMGLAHKLSIQLRVAEERIAGMGGKLAEAEARAERAADERIREMEAELAQVGAAAAERVRGMQAELAQTQAAADERVAQAVRAADKRVEELKGELKRTEAQAAAAGERAKRASEQRIAELARMAAELERANERAQRAEAWLRLIEKTVEDKLIAPLAAARAAAPR